MLMGLAITKSLKDSLTDLYCREECDQKGWAYIPACDIKFADNSLVFRKSNNQIHVKIHPQIVPEIKDLSKSFDYLVCKVGQKEKYDSIVANPAALCWLKVNSKKTRFSQSLADALERTQLPLAVLCINDVLAAPRKVEIEWDIRPAKDWLDELDDIKDQAEYDDEFF